MFIRKIKFNSNRNFDEENSVPSIRFLNEFEAQKSLFNKEGIALESTRTSTYLNVFYRFRNIQGREFGKEAVESIYLEGFKESPLGSACDPFNAKN